MLLREGLDSRDSREPKSLRGDVVLSANLTCGFINRDGEDDVVGEAEAEARAEDDRESESEVAAGEVAVAVVRR